MKWILRSIFAALLVLSVASVRTVFAKPPPPNYLTLKAGGFFPVSSDLKSFDTGFNGELAVGRYVTPGFALELAVGNLQTTGTVSEETANVRRKLEATSLLLSLKGLVPFDRWEGFAEVGTGVYFIRDDLGGHSDDQSRVGVHVGFGGTLNLTRKFFLGLEARYLLLKAYTFDTGTRLDGVTLTGNLGYRF